MKEQQKVDEPLMSYPAWLRLNNILYPNWNEIQQYANYVTQYHLQRQAEFIAEKAEVKFDYSEFGMSYSVDKQSILSASKEYVELNIKR